MGLEPVSASAVGRFRVKRDVDAGIFAFQIVAAALVLVAWERLNRIANAHVAVEVDAVEELRNEGLSGSGVYEFGEANRTAKRLGRSFGGEEGGTEQSSAGRNLELMEC